MQLDFNQFEKNYLIDTSALIILESTFKYDNPVFKAIWEEIEDLIGKGCFKTIDFVEEEINSYEGKEDFLKKWVHKWRKYLVVDTDAGSINAARPIINSEYSSGFFDMKKQAEGKEEADPYLIAYCKVHNCILITNESKTKHNKIPAISKKYDVKCIDINDFLIDRSMRMERKK
ncbi:DUF4411 family protein [Flavobacterium sp.]|uniref:DUF4411 family protein n=1 Tax=Flavobacterium sp. TaxID=239 RepID=UPI0025C26FB8|nr:DUF4411 family protein [Flavobacterium sp.]MBA4154712.1 hypothetical protein [Flavobacterium sp.]